MSNWMRIGLAVVVGVMIGGACVAGIEMLGHNFMSGNSLFMVAAVGIGVSALTGGLVAIWIGRTPVAAWIVAGGLGCLSLINVFSFPHPVWFVPAVAVLLIMGALAATRLMRGDGKEV